MEAIRINKYIRECGLASRREADRMIEEGRVTVNGVIADPGMPVSEGDVICVDGNEIKPVADKHVVVYYKPKGVTCTKEDVHAELTLEQVFSYPVPLTYAGRLDKDSEGLLIMTNDGELIDRLMRSRFGHEKEYEVVLKHEVTDDFLVKFAGGVYLPELEVVTKRCKIKQLGKNKVDIILTQGLNRQIRRMCKTLGNEVVSLKRIRVENILLGDLKPGEMRRVSAEEETELRRILQL
jgi:pseudouridine synthase